MAYRRLSDTMPIDRVRLVLAICIIQYDVLPRVHHFPIAVLYKWFSFIMVSRFGENCKELLTLIKFVAQNLINPAHCRDWQEVPNDTCRPGTLFHELMSENVLGYMSTSCMPKSIFFQEDIRDLSPCSDLFICLFRIPLRVFLTVAHSESSTVVGEVNTVVSIGFVFRKVDPGAFLPTSYAELSFVASSAVWSRFVESLFKIK
jgi:hypothetical protein